MANPEEEFPRKVYGWAARDTSGHLSPLKFSRRLNGEDDVTLKVLYCGICHTDLHFIRNDFGMTSYPCVPGHEITGIVTEVGTKVTKFKVGDKVGIGCLVNSCKNCDACKQDLENYCPAMVQTYSWQDRDGSITKGGYSNMIVADQSCVIKIPEAMPMDGAAPLLCAGITVYSPMKYYGLSKPGMRIGVLGLGGLGHVAVKFAKALGLHVTVISTSPSKKQEAIEKHGADAFLVSRNEEEMQAAAGTFDGIINTVSAHIPLLPYINLLRLNGKLIMVGANPKPYELPVFPLLMGRKLVGGSAIGGIKETQEMIDLAAKHGITADIELIPMDYVNTAIERLEKNDVKYRFVIDIANTLKPE